MATFTLPSAELEQRARAIRLVLLDVDGVLTDGRLSFVDGDAPGVSFNIQDGLGLKLLQQAGLRVGLLSGRSSAAVERRARDLRLDHAILGRVDKGVALTELLAEIGVADHELAFAGDDLPDLAVLARCGLGFAPANAVTEVRAAAHVQLERRGGEGAVRELVELLLGWRGVWTEIVDHFRR